MVSVLKFVIPKIRYTENFGKVKVWFFLIPTFRQGIRHDGFGMVYRTGSAIPYTVPKVTVWQKSYRYRTISFGIPEFGIPEIRYGSFPYRYHTVLLEYRTAFRYIVLLRYTELRYGIPIYRYTVFCGTAYRYTIIPWKNLLYPKY